MADRERKEKSKPPAGHANNASGQKTNGGECGKDLVSVIIPTYNRAKHVAKAVASVLNQTCKNYEIIVVDDGSTDNTREVLEPYMGKIRYLYQDNAGAYVARNVGILQAKGEWIAFLDSDDQWLPEKLARQLEAVHRTGIKACFTNFLCVDENKTWQEYGCAEPEKRVDGEEVLTDPFELFIMGGHPLHLPTMLVSKNLLKKVGCFDERLRIGDDTRLILDLAFETPFVFVHSVELMSNQSEAREGLVNTRLDTVRERVGIQISILSKAYFHERAKSRAAITGIRHRLGYALSRRAEIACIDKQYRDAKRFAKDALYFGDDFKTYLRSLAVWLWPQFVARIRKGRWKE